MIYTKATNFSYPILNNLQDDYMDKHFNIEITTDYKDGRNFQFRIKVDLDSDFLLEQIKNHRTKLLLVVSAIDSRFYEFSLDDPVVKIPDNRVYLKENTKFQVLLMSKDRISFENNQDIHPFYEDFKDKIFVEAGKLLAFSNDYTFTGDIEKSTQLFKQKIDPSMEFPVNIELNYDNILIEYRDAESKFKNISNARDLNNMYLYAGLQKALLNLVSKNLENETPDQQGSLEDGILVERINSGSPLDMKLKNLLIDKGIEQLYLENIDSAVQKIAERIVEKYVEAINKENE